MDAGSGGSAEAVRHVLPNAVVAGHEQQVSTDHANVSIAVDGRWLVKWFRRPITDADLHVLVLLTERGFAHMPAHLGALHDGDAVVAVVSELLPGATDGWVWFVDDVLAWLDSGAGLDDLVRTAASMGTIAGRLHLALAEHDVQRVPLGSLRSLVSERREAAITHTAGDAGLRLRLRLGQIDAALSALDTLGPVPMQRVHGDLHAGQFLRGDDRDRLVLTDFDGDPMTASADRLAVQPAERDLAGLVQSIDHVGRVAVRRRPGADVSPFVAAAVDAALGAYAEVRPYDDALLWPLRVAQELHEYAYAALHLPVWGYVPDAAMCHLFPEEDPA
jgi:maltokinase